MESLGRFVYNSVNFDDAKMVDHILEFPSLVVLDVKFLSEILLKLCVLTYNAARNKDDIKVVT